MLVARKIMTVKSVLLILMLIGSIISSGSSADLDKYGGTDQEQSADENTDTDNNNNGKIDSNKVFDDWTNNDELLPVLQFYGEQGKDEYVRDELLNRALAIDNSSKLAQNWLKTKSSNPNSKVLSDGDEDSGRNLAVNEMNKEGLEIVGNNNENEEILLVEESKDEKSDEKPQNLARDILEEISSQYVLEDPTVAPDIAPAGQEDTEPAENKILTSDSEDKVQSLDEEKSDAESVKKSSPEEDEEEIEISADQKSNIDSADPEGSNGSNESSGSEEEEAAVTSSVIPKTRRKLLQPPEDDDEEASNLINVDGGDDDGSWKPIFTVRKQPIEKEPAVNNEDDDEDEEDDHDESSNEIDDDEPKKLAPEEELKLALDNYKESTVPKTSTADNAGGRNTQLQGSDIEEVNKKEILKPNRNRTASATSVKLKCPKGRKKPRLTKAQADDLEKEKILRYICFGLLFFLVFVLCVYALLSCKKYWKRRCHQRRRGRGGRSSPPAHCGISARRLVEEPPLSGSNTSSSLMMDEMAANERYYSTSGVVNSLRPQTFVLDENSNRQQQLLLASGQQQPKPEVRMPSSSVGGTSGANGSGGDMESIV